MEEVDFSQKKKKKKIEIVKGDRKNLKISDVKDNLNFEIDENTGVKKENIVIPENQSNQ